MTTYAAAHLGVRPHNAAIWTGRILGTIAALFMTMDAVAHLVRPQPVVTAFAQLGLSLDLSVPIGLIALACTAFFVVPRTAYCAARREAMRSSAAISSTGSVSSTCSAGSSRARSLPCSTE